MSYSMQLSDTGSVPKLRNMSQTRGMLCLSDYSMNSPQGQIEQGDLKHAIKFDSTKADPDGYFAAC